MRNMKKVIAAVLALAMVFALSACCLKHNYAPATCTEPETCTECGKTRGEALGHTTVPATCTEPETCTVCGATFGEALGHTESAMMEGAIDFVNAEINMYSVCTVCGAELSNTNEKLASFIDGNSFRFTVNDFNARFEKVFAENKTLDLKTLLHADSKGVAELVITNKNGYELAYVWFYIEGDDIINLTDADTARVASIRCIVPMLEDLDDSTMFYLFGEIADIISKTCDDSLIGGTSYKDAITNNAYAEKDEGALDLYGVYYSCGLRDETLIFDVTLK